MNDVTNLADTIKPKSDQLNADDMLTGPITLTVSNVRRGSDDQPVLIDSDSLMPFKPCKTMRRVLVTAWGVDGKKWIGKSMTLFCDPSVKFGGVALGGIRISHLSHINGSINMMLTASKGRKSQVVVHQLIEVDYSEVINKYLAMSDAKEKESLWSSLSPDQKAAIRLAGEKAKQNEEPS
jgi:hypothetical protein